MKTKPPLAITTVDEAKAFLTDLHNNGEAFHPEDNAHDITFCVEPICREQRDHLNDLMEQIYALPGNDGRHVAPMIFDPCEFLNVLNGVVPDDDEEVTFEDLKTALASAIKFIKFYHRGENAPKGLERWEALIS